MDVSLPDVNQTVAPDPEQRLRALSRNRPKSMEEIDKAAKEFESVYLAEMLRPMVKEIKLPKPYGGGHAEEMYQSLMVDEYAKAIAKAGGIGVADHIKHQLIQLQEKKQ